MELTKERQEARIAPKILSAFTLALSEARKFEGATAPNPPVGCVLLDVGGNTLAVAVHQKAGQLHAEAMAIKQCREAGRADCIHTAVVTLEPCNHTGRTSPCAEAILSTPAREVWIGMVDPNPHVAGGGADRLRNAGLKVQILDMADAPQLKQELRRLVGPFAKRITKGLPWMTVKQAINREGSMVPPKGQKTFTSQSSLILAHTLRRRADAIITGSGTVLSDDPHFTVHLVPDFPNKYRKLVLFDRRRRIPQSYIDAAKGRSFTVSFADNLNEALQQLANYHRRQFDIPVIAIGGSNGKTTTKELISSVLTSHYPCHFTKGNFNNHIGVPLTLLSMPRNTEVAVIEMGTNQAGDIEQLCQIALPTHGLLTNIGKEHLEGFGNLAGVKKAEGELFDFLRERMSRTKKQSRSSAPRSNPAARL